MDVVLDATLGACGGYAKCGSIYRCKLDVMNRTGLSRNAWNLLRVCKSSQQCSVPSLSRLDATTTIALSPTYGAMARVVQILFALTLCVQKTPYV